MDDTSEFQQSKRAMAAAMAEDPHLRALALQTLVEADRFGYTFQWEWLGLPIIQSPADIIAQQEIIWTTRPTVIIETGVARGGSMIFLASMLRLTEGRKVIGIDIDIRAHNRGRIEAHPLASLVTLIEGSSVEASTLASVREQLDPTDRVMVILDSNHTHDHVLQELQLYAPLVTVGQYLIVADTVIELIPAQTHRPRPWGPGNNPLTAVRTFLMKNHDFSLDAELDSKMILSCNPSGFLRRTQR